VRTVADLAAADRNAVELVRPLFMDQWPAHPLRHGLVLLGFAVAAFWIALALTRKRFRN
jgi:lipooligosaccharide transport system permease protein